MSNQPQQQQTQQDLALLSDRLHSSIIYADYEYKEPQEVIWVNDSPIATLGNFSVTTGKAKSRKTFNVSALVAAALANKQVLGYRAKMPKYKGDILYFDTEQSAYHCHRVLLRILKLAGIEPTSDECRRLRYVCLRPFSPSERKALIEYAIDQWKCFLGLVVIDGIRDLMLDINDSEESVLLTNDLMRLSANYNIHIHVALHLNKSDDNVRGHIGTEVNNKAESVLLVSKDRYDDNMSEVSPLYLRDKEFKPFRFIINEDGIPEDVYGYKNPDENKRAALAYTSLSEEQHQQALKAAFNGGLIKGKNKAMLALMQGYATVDFERGQTTFGKILDTLVDKGTVVHQGKHEYFLRCDFPTLGLEDESKKTKGE